MTCVSVKNWSNHFLSRIKVQFRRPFWVNLFLFFLLFNLRWAQLYVSLVFLSPPSPSSSSLDTQYSPEQSSTGQYRPVQASRALHQIMDFTVNKLGRHAKCTWCSFQFKSRGPFQNNLFHLEFENIVGQGWSFAVSGGALIIAYLFSIVRSVTLQIVIEIKVDIYCLHRRRSSWSSHQQTTESPWEQLEAGWMAAAFL